MPKILIIRFSSIGDIVLTTPVFRCIKKQIPDAEVHLVTKKSFKIVTENNPYIDDFFYYEKDLDGLIEALKKQEYDYVIDLQNNLRSNKIKFLLKKKSFTLNKLNVRKWVFTKFHLNVMPKKHLVIRNLETVEKLGIKDDGLGLDYFIPENDIVEQNDMPSSHHFGFIAIIIAANYYTKKLPVDKLKELCMKINYPIVLLGGKTEQEEGKLVASIDPIKIYNSCGKFNLNESADLIRQSKLVITNDTGLMHIAAALKKPIITIWGNTTPFFGMYPYYGIHSNQIFQNTEVDGLFCRPCSKIGFHKCPLGHFNCMRKQDIEAIVSKVHSRLGLSS